MRDALGNVGVVGARGEVARLDHVHPGFAIVDQGVLEGFAGRILRTDQADDALPMQIVLEDVPRQLVCELEPLNQTLLFELGELSLLGQGDRSLQGLQRLEVVVEALLPANVFNHG